MRWCRFMQDGRSSYGMVAGAELLPVTGTPFDEPRTSGPPVSLSAVRLLPPVLPFTFFAAGFNYMDHILHSQAAGSKLARRPERPEPGYRANNALIGQDDAVIVPADFTGQLEAEGELVAVIGRRLRHCSRAEAVAGILGWTIGNDVSAREWQKSDRTFWRAKNSDTFKPMGPWIETELDPRQSRTCVSVNGEPRCEFATGGMLFDAIDFIVEIARYITLQPGDVLWLGADGTTGIQAGDTVAIEISGIGTLRNPVRREVLPG